MKTRTQPTHVDVAAGWLTKKQAAERMGVRTVYLDRILASGGLGDPPPLLLFDAVLLFDEAQVERYIREHPQLGRRRSRALTKL